LTDESKTRLLASWSSRQIEVSWIQPDAQLLRGLTVSRHVSLATYYRVLMPRLLPAEVTRAIYLDADLLVRADLGRLWNEDQAGAACLAVPDTAAPYIDAREALPSYARCRRYLAASEPVPNFRELGLAPTAKYFNAGVLVADLALWRARDLTDQLLRCLHEQRQHVQWWDQYALNVVLADQWRELDPRWNQGAHAYTFPTWRESPFDQATFQQLRADPWIVHFTSREKPWHYYCRHPFRRDFLTVAAETAWRGWRPELPRERGWYAWWTHRFAPVRHWSKVYATRLRSRAVVEH